MKRAITWGFSLLLIAVFSVFSAWFLFYNKDISINQATVVGVNKNIESGEIESISVRLRGVMLEVRRADVQDCDHTWNTLRESDEILIYSYTEYWKVFRWTSAGTEYFKMMSLELGSEER